MNFDALKPLDRAGWVIAQTGGNCMVSYKNFICKDGIERAVGVNEECVVIYNVPFAQIEFGTGESELHVFNIDAPLGSHLAVCLDRDQSYDVIRLAEQYRNWRDKE